MSSPKKCDLSGAEGNCTPEGSGESRDALGQRLVVQHANPSAGALEDPLIYPGLYAPSGFDMMSILVRSLELPLTKAPNQNLQSPFTKHSPK
jgi:hypothetical protein